MKPALTAALIAAATGLLTPTSATGPLDIAEYDVTIDYRPDDGVLRGSAVITATAPSALDEVALHLDGPVVSAVTLDDTPVKSFAQNGGDLAITPSERIRPGARFRVRVDYEGKPGPGWLPTDSGGATAFQGASSTWFPVGDARDRADFRLTGTAPAGWHVVAVGREQQAPGPTTMRWAALDIAPDNIAVSVDRFTVDRSTLPNGIPVVNAYAPGLREKTAPLADRLPEILDFLTTRYGTYPFEAAGNVFVHVNNDGPGTSPQTRPVYLGARSDYMDLLQVVHEQAHQWYGVSVGARLPEDACLSECFASHSTWMWEEAKDRVDLDERYRSIVTAKKADAAFWREPLYQAGKQPGFQMYDRGPLALHALHRKIGTEAFGRLLTRWAQENRHSTASWPRFEHLAQQVGGQDLTGFLAAWFHGTAVPPDDFLWPGGLKP
ncbi:M1 family aminopeptidase [Umezawaea tangerina]|uniref:Peptidase M1 membrane alanine aminopeptidase domain-containing protein n=1 Tax=Umezawaea tangerina TaxID=84725 RepID=A0A2T0SZY3_9PSEU|nr:M1 family aminopeptidase [Umezawaea tangerina]PRY38923.1 hypothetical protein CLV43_108323 [Umezawaea tangerina]